MGHSSSATMWSAMRNAFAVVGGRKAACVLAEAEVTAVACDQPP
jgi:hypothetical protein